MRGSTFFVLIIAGADAFLAGAPSLRSCQSGVASMSMQVRNPTLVPLAV